jgi:catalase-peroxidase
VGPDLDVNWGDEKAWLAHRDPEALAKHPLAATEMGLIYVNPEGPNASGDPASAAPAIRATFGNMAMDDEETVALIAGGHTLGKTHGAGPASHVGADPEAAPIEQQGLGWTSSFGSGVGADAITSGLEVVWTQTPTQWSHQYFENLFKYEWVQVRSPAGAIQFEAKDAREHPRPLRPGQEAQAHHAGDRPDAALRPGLREDLAPLPERPAGLQRGLRPGLVQAHPPRHGPQGPLPGPGSAQGRPGLAGPAARAGACPHRGRHRRPQGRIAATGLSVGDLVSVAWASASTFRGGDKRGGANGARLALAPQKDWAVNQRAAKVLPVLQAVQQASGKASLADVIVLAGGVGVEQAAKAAGVAVEVPFTPGRVDARQDQTEIASFAVMEPVADGFRNFGRGQGKTSTEALLIDKAQQLTLTAPELTVLVGGLRVLGANADGSDLGVFTDRVGVLSNDFFVNLLDMGTAWQAADASAEVFEGRDRRSGTVKHRASRADLVFGSNSVLRALAEVYASSDAKTKFVQDFVAAWTKVMNLDRFDLA